MDTLNGREHATSRSSPAAGPAPPSSANASAQVVVTRLSYPAGSPRPSSSARRARNNPRYPARVGPWPACTRPPAPAPAAARPAHRPAPAAAPPPVRPPRPGPAEPRRHLQVQHRDLQHLLARPGPELAGDHHPPPARRRHQARDRRRVRHVIEHQQPGRRASTACTRPTGITARRRPGARPARRTRPPAPPGPRPQLPHHPDLAAAGGRTPAPRWSCPHPPARTTPPPAARRRRSCQPGIQVFQQFLPPGQEHRPRRQPHRHPLRSAAARPGSPARTALWRLPQGRQRLEQQHLQPVRGIHWMHRDSRVLHPLPERPLPLPVHRIGQEHTRQRQDRVLIQHEHQPRQAQLSSGVEFQLRIGTARLVPDRRAVPEPDDPRVHIGLPDLLPAVPCGFLLPGGEIRHVHHHAARPDHRLLGCRHERPARRMLAQLGGMAHEHPQRPLHKRSRYRYLSAAQPRNHQPAPGPTVRADTAPPRPAHWAYKTGRCVFAKTHNRPASSTRRLVIEAAYPL